MSGVWKRLHPKAAGSLPGNLITQWGVAITALLILGFLTVWIFLGGGEQETAPGPGADGEQQSPRDFAAQMAARVEQEGLREQQRQSARDRDQMRRQAAEGIAGGRVSRGGGARPGNEEGAATGAAYTEEEWRLRETLRLEEMERRSRSLRSTPVAQTYREPERSAPGQAPESQEVAAAAQVGPSSTLEQLQKTFEEATAGINAEAEAAVAAEAARITSRECGDGAGSRGGGLPARLHRPAPHRSTRRPARMGTHP